MQKPFAQAFSPAKLPRTLLLLAAGAAIAFPLRGILMDTAGVLFGACLLAFLLSPPFRLLEKRLAKSLAALLCILLLAIALALAAAFLLPLLLREGASLLDRLPAALDRLHILAQQIAARIEGWMPGFRLPAMDFSAAGRDLGEIAQHAAATIGDLAGGIYRIVLSVVLAYFLLVDRDKILLRCEMMVPSHWRRNAVQLGNSLLRELRLYLRGQACIALAVGILSGAALCLIGVRSGMLLGMIVGIFNMIPYFGPVLGSIPAVLFALGDGWHRAAFAAAAMLIVQQIDGMLISPRIMGSITGFSPASVLLALFIGSGIGGLWGLLLAMPLLLCLRTLYRVFVQTHEND